MPPAQTFTICTSGTLVDRATRTATVSADGITLTPGGTFAWADFTAYRGVLPHTLVHRDGRTLVIGQAGNGRHELAELRACLQAMAQAIAAHNADRAPETQLRPNVEAEWRAARRQRGAALVMAAAALLLLVVAATIPAPMPMVVLVLPVALVVLCVAYAIVLNRRLRTLAAQRRGEAVPAD